MYVVPLGKKLKKHFSFRPKPSYRDALKVYLVISLYGILKKQKNSKSQGSLLINGSKVLYVWDIMVKGPHKKIWGQKPLFSGLAEVPKNGFFLKNGKNWPFLRLHVCSPWPKNFSWGPLTMISQTYNTLGPLIKRLPCNFEFFCFFRILYSEITK